MRKNRFRQVLCTGVLAAALVCHAAAADYTANDAGRVTYDAAAQTYTASYDKAIANKEYTLMVVQGTKSNDTYQYTVTPETTMYIRQAVADDQGKIQFTFIPKEVTDCVVLLGGSFADGDSPKVLGTLLEVEEDTGGSGDSGSSGDTGGSGDTGDSGDSGDTGGSGDSGDSGDTDGSGDSGDTGDSGDSSSSGDSGDTGGSGDSGDSGDTDGSGDSGDTGSSGNSDGSGDSGDSGSAGGSSNSGGSGSSGDSGDSGSSGNDEAIGVVVPSVKEEDGSFTTNLSGSDSEKLVDTAKQNSSSTVVITPEVDKNAEKVTVTIPSQTVNSISGETASNVMISTPSGSVILPNETLKELAACQSDLSFTVDASAPGQVEITVQAGNTTLDALSGSITAVIPVKDTANTGLVAVQVNPDGSETILVHSALTDAGLAVSLDGSATIKVVDNSKVFTDVGNHWAKDNIRFVTARGIFGGMGAATFSPNVGMTRGMLVTVLYNLHGAEYSGSMTAFQDVATNAWYAPGVNWAAANGIVSGVGNGMFAPNSDITREQTAVILMGYARMMGLDTDGRSNLERFHDAEQVSFWASDAMEWAVHSGLISGMPGDLLAPQGTTSRAEMATIMRKFVEFSLR